MGLEACFFIEADRVCCRVQATQRAGRAGRVCNGKCYRLYTTQFFEREMSESTVPEIQRTNMLTAVLYLKSLPLDIDVLAFDYLDSPGVRHTSSNVLQEPALSSTSSRSVLNAIPESQYAL